LASLIHQAAGSDRGAVFQPFGNPEDSFPRFWTYPGAIVESQRNGRRRDFGQFSDIFDGWLLIHLLYRQSNLMEKGKKLSRKNCSLET
jgi:hypothetical protein